MKTGDETYCPGTLAGGFTTYSPACLRNVFSGKKVSHILPYEQPRQNEDVAEQFFENRKRISISGVQEKLSLLLDKNVFAANRRRGAGNLYPQAHTQRFKKGRPGSCQRTPDHANSKTSIWTEYGRKRYDFSSGMVPLPTSPNDLT